MWQVANGTIPEAVERWLRDNIRLKVQPWAFVNAIEGESRAWLLSAEPGANGPVYDWAFDWPHDTPPTLQQAIEAVARGSV